MIEKTHKFPGPYLFKVVVPATDKKQLIAIVAQGSVKKENLSKSGKYSSLTIEKTFNSAQEVIEQYQSIKAIKNAIVL